MKCWFMATHFEDSPPSNGIPAFELIVITNSVEARYDAETDVGVMHDEGRGPLQIASLETAARPIHHDAVMPSKRLHRVRYRQQMRRPGQANQTHELEVDPVATIDLPSGLH